MSSASFMHKNLNWDQVVNILCYSTQKPHLLSKKQQVTRLYKAFVRYQFDNTIRSTMRETRQIMRDSLMTAKLDFGRMLKLSINDQEYIDLQTRYKQFIAKNYDPTMLFFDNQEHSPNSQKVIFFTDEVF